MHTAKTIVAIAMVSILAMEATARNFKGACPTVSSIAYDSSMATSRAHKIHWVDSTVATLYNTASKAIKSAPKLSCLNVGNWGISQTQYNDRHLGSTDLARSKLLYWDSASGTELHYACLDSARLDQLLNYAKSEGVDLTSYKWAVDMIKSVFGLNNGHYRLMALFSSGNTIPSGVMTTIKNMFPVSSTNKIPSWLWFLVSPTGSHSTGLVWNADMTAINHSTCSA